MNLRQARGDTVTYKKPGKQTFCDACAEAASQLTEEELNRRAGRDPFCILVERVPPPATLDDGDVVDVVWGAIRAERENRRDGTRTILGLDPSTVATGWAVLHLAGHVETITASGVYAPKSDVAFDDLLVGAYRWLRGAIDAYTPDVLSIETPFYRLNAKTLIRLAGVGAVFRLAARRCGLEVHEVPPARRCTALGLAGNAEKSQVLYTVNAVYGLAIDDHNEADAVAVAAACALALRTEHLRGGM